MKWAWNSVFTTAWGHPSGAQSPFVFKWKCFVQLKSYSEVLTKGPGSKWTGWRGSAAPWLQGRFRGHILWALKSCLWAASCCPPGLACGGGGWTEHPTTSRDCLWGRPSPAAVSGWAGWPWPKAFVPKEKLLLSVILQGLQRESLQWWQCANLHCEDMPGMGTVGPRMPGACQLGCKGGEAHTLKRTWILEHRRPEPARDELSPQSSLFGGLAQLVAIALPAVQQGLGCPSWGGPSALPVALFWLNLGPSEVSRRHCCPGRCCEN